MRTQSRLLTATFAAALMGVVPAPALELRGRVELLEKGKPSADKTLAVDATVVVFEPQRPAPPAKPVSNQTPPAKPVSSQISLSPPSPA